MLRCVFVVAVVGASCARKPLTTRCIALAETGIHAGIPLTLEPRTVTNDPGYVDVIVGEPGRDACVVGIEVYLAAATDRPRDLAALQRSVEHDHVSSYRAIVAPRVVQRDGRPTVTATFESSKPDLRQRQWAFMLDGDPIVVSVYANGALDECVPLETAILSKISRGSCSPARAAP